jgi:hypothetical protein
MIAESPHPAFRLDNLIFPLSAYSGKGKFRLQPFATFRREITGLRPPLPSSRFLPASVAPELPVDFLRFRSYFAPAAYSLQPTPHVLLSFDNDVDTI